MRKLDTYQFRPPVTRRAKRCVAAVSIDNYVRRVVSRVLLFVIDMWCCCDLVLCSYVSSSLRLSFNQPNYTVQRRRFIGVPTAWTPVIAWTGPNNSWALNILHVQFMKTAFETWSLVWLSFWPRYSEQVGAVHTLRQQNCTFFITLSSCILSR